MTQYRKKILINLIVGLIISAIVFLAQMKSEYSIFHQLCDCFFVTAVLLGGVGVLKFARNSGSFDMVFYGVDAALRVALPWIMPEKKDTDYVAYVERKKEERKPAADLLVVGGIYLALSLLMLVIYLATT